MVFFSTLYYQIVSDFAQDAILGQPARHLPDHIDELHRRRSANAFDDLLIVPPCPQLPSQCHHPAAFDFKGADQRIPLIWINDKLHPVH